MHSPSSFWNDGSLRRCIRAAACVNNVHGDVSLRNGCNLPHPFSDHRVSFMGAVSPAGLLSQSMSPSVANAASFTDFTLPPLPYDYKSLEPSIDEGLFPCSVLMMTASDVHVQHAVTHA